MAISWEGRRYNKTIDIVFIKLKYKLFVFNEKTMICLSFSRMTNVICDLIPPQY